MRKIESVCNWVLFCGVVLFFSGCAVGIIPKTESVTGTPIRSDNVGKLVKGKTTKLEVIELFGMPSTAGTSMPGMPTMGGGMLPGAIITSGSDEIYIYKHCKTKSSGASVSLFATTRMGTEEKCEQLSVLLNKNEVVKAFSYITDDPINETTTSKLTKGKSNKIAVIELVGAPSSINVSGNDEIYTFKRCVNTTEASVWSGGKRAENCKQLTVILDKNSEIVKTYSYQQ